VKLVVLRIGGPVSQIDLENLLQIDAEIARQTALRDRIAAGILSRITSGVDVEPGHRTYDIEETYSGRARRQKLIVR
jgi:hypothetical protein